MGVFSCALVSAKQTRCGYGPVTHHGGCVVQEKPEERDRAHAWIKGEGNESPDRLAREKREILEFPSSRGEKQITTTSFGGWGENRKFPGNIIFR